LLVVLEINWKINVILRDREYHLYADNKKQSTKTYKMHLSS